MLRKKIRASLTMNKIFYLYKRKLLIFLCLLSALLFLFPACGKKKSIEVIKKKAGEVELAYYTRGKGDPLLMIMGFRGTMSFWDPALLEELEKHYTLILFDNRGVGLSSDTEKNNTTISQMAQDTAELIKELGFKKVHLLGWSMGARIAQELAVTQPELIKTLILCSANPGGKYQAPRKTEAYKKLTAEKISKPELLSLLFPPTKAGLEASSTYAVHLIAGIETGTIPNDIEVNNTTVERQIQALQLWNQSGRNYELLEDVKIPTLVTGGLEDILDNPKNVEIVANRIPFAWTAYFPGAGHGFLFQDHLAFSKLVHLFIQMQKNNTKERQ